MKSLLLCMLLIGCSVTKPLRRYEGILKEGVYKRNIVINAIYNSRISSKHERVFEILISNESMSGEMLNSIQVLNYQIMNQSDVEAWKHFKMKEYDEKLDLAKKTDTPYPDPKAKEDLKRLTEALYMHSPVELPSSMVSSYWVLIKTPEKKRPKSIMLQLKYADSTEAKYELIPFN